MAKPTEDYWITVRFKSNGVKERTFTGSDDNVLLCNFVKDNFINAREIEYNWSFSKEENWLNDNWVWSKRKESK
tara:strand:+ start:506 stop:727 length:222 start_codon:yes stop_codon:yes gene_type:complete